MSKNFIQFVVIILGVFIILAFLAIIYGMYLKMALLDKQVGIVSGEILNRKKNTML